MSRILVDTPDGESLSLRLSERDNPDFPADLERLRAFPQRKYSDREGVWLVPPTDLNLAHLAATWDPAALEVTEAARTLLEYHRRTRAAADAKLAERVAYFRGEEVPWPADYAFATKPHAHQAIAFSSARSAEYFALLMEMGTGKSKVVVDVICDRARRARATWEAAGRRGPVPQVRALVVAPKSVTHNWATEFEKHATLDVALARLRGAKLKRVRDLVELLQERVAPVVVAVINYEGLQVIEDALDKVPWDLMVCDESIWIKNPSARRSKAAYRLGERARSRFILTGLPIARNVLDLYGQFHFLKPGCLGFTSFWAYQNYYGERNFWGGFSSWKKEKLPELQERLARFSFAVRRHQCLDLPPKIYQTLEIEMAPDQAKAYQQMVEDMIVDLERVGEVAAPCNADPELSAAVDAAIGPTPGSSPVDRSAEDNRRFSTARIVLVKLLRLAQITSGFVKRLDGELHRFAKNPKLDALEELLDQLDPGDKVLVWSRFVEDLRAVHERLNAKHGVALFHGGLSDATREKNLERWRADPATRIFAGQPQSGGFGLNLVEATHCVYFANDFSLQARSQSEDRCHRIGQTRNVLYTDLVVPSSIDSLVLARLKEKRDLADLLTDRKRVLEALRQQLGVRRE